MKFHFVLMLIILGSLTPAGIAFAVDEFFDDVKLQNGKSVFYDDHSVSIGRTNVNGDDTGSLLTVRGLNGIIMKTAGNGTFGTGDESFRVTSDGHLSIVNGKTIQWGGNAVSLGKTNTSGDGPGSYLTLRGFDGIIMQTKGDSTFGTGVESFRVTPNGDLTLQNGKSMQWNSAGVSIAKTNSNGDGTGSFLNLRGFSGIVMRTGGDGFFGTGDEAFRISSPSGNVGIGVSNPTEKLDVNGNIRLTGDIVSPTDICIGSCP
jgi:hypothetical protein